MWKLRVWLGLQTNLSDWDILDIVTAQLYLTQAGSDHQGSRIILLSNTAVSYHLFVKGSAYVILLKQRQKGRNFQIKMYNIQYTLDNVSNIYLTKC